MEALTIESPKINFEYSSNIQLMDHQLAVVNAMLQWETNPTFPLTLENFESCYDDANINIKNSMGILADSVGAGKTHAVVALSLYQPPTKVYKFRVKNVFLPSNNNRFRCTESQSSCLKTTLVLVPHGLFHMWKSVCESFDTTLDYYFVSTKKALNVFNPQNNYNIVIVTNTFWRPFNEKFGTVQWGRWVTDEIDSIKIPNNPVVKTNFIWFITATPFKLGLYWRGYKRWHHPIRNHGYVNKILHDVFGTLSWYKDNPWEWISKVCVRCEPSFIEQSIELPSLQWHTIHCEQPLAIADISQHNIVPEVVMNHLNAGDVKGAILRLNGSKSNNLLEAVTDHLRKNLAKKKKHHEDLVEKKSKQKTIIKCLEEIAVAQKTLDTTVQRFQTIAEDNCPICLDSIQQRAAVRCCGRMFCFECLVKSLGSKCICPMCRSKINLNQDFIVEGENELPDEDIETKTKPFHLRRLLNDNPSARTLIFSEYDNTFHSVIDILKEMNISYGILKGNGHVVKSIIQKFHKGEIPVLMLNASFQGSGHNLQSADRVILYHELPLNLKKQVIGRAQRYGRTESLDIYQFRYKSEEDTGEISIL